MKILLFILAIFLVLFSCNNDSTQYFKVNAHSDTILIVKKRVHNRTFMTVKVSGKIEDDCSIILQQDKIPDDKVLKREYVLKKGILNVTISKDDLYDNSAKIIFKHKNNKKGYLNFEVLF